MQKTFSRFLLISILAFLSIFNLMAGGKSKIDWTQLTSFRIYDYKTFPEGKDIRTFSEKDINQMNFIETNLSETKNILSKAIPLDGKTYIWKGHHFALATFNGGQKRRIKISGYGGFFMDITNNEYYEFRSQAREEWDKFWSENYNELHKKK